MRPNKGTWLKIRSIKIVSGVSELVSQMTETVKALALSGIRQRYPQSNPQQQKRLLADVLLGEALAKQVYGPLLETVDHKNCNS